MYVLFTLKTRTQIKLESICWNDIEDYNICTFKIFNIWQEKNSYLQLLQKKQQPNQNVQLTNHLTKGHTSKISRGKVNGVQVIVAKETVTVEIMTDEKLTMALEGQGVEVTNK